MLEKGADIERTYYVNGNAINRFGSPCFKRTPLSLAASNGSSEVVKLLIEKGASIECEDEVGRTPLSLAVENDHSEVMNILLAKGAEIEHNGIKWRRTPLSWAAYIGHSEVVELSLENGADIKHKSNDGSSPLYLAT